MGTNYGNAGNADSKERLWGCANVFGNGIVAFSVFSYFGLRKARLTIGNNEQIFFVKVTSIFKIEKVH